MTISLYQAKKIKIPLSQKSEILKIRFRFMAYNATFNNISVISCRSVLLVEETGAPGENHRPDKLDHHNGVSSIRTHNVIGDSH